MAHIKNDDFYLYTGLVANGDECHQALVFMQATGIQFKHLHYGDPVQHPNVIASVAGWFPGTGIVPAFPFVHWSEINELTDTNPEIRKIANGLDEIKSADWVSLFNFAGSTSGG